MGDRLEAERQILLLTQETELLREQARDLPGPDGLLGRSACIRAVRSAIRQVAPTRSTVLITGEPGTRKELVARTIHRESPRSAQPISLSIVPPSPPRSSKANVSATNAARSPAPPNVATAGSSLPTTAPFFSTKSASCRSTFRPNCSASCRRAHSNPSAPRKRCGSTCASWLPPVATFAHGPPRAGSAKISWLNIFPIEVPPRRDRGADLEELAGHFVQRFAQRMGKTIDPLSHADRALLHDYDWPGNVREIQNVIERLSSTPTDPASRSPVPWPPLPPSRP